MMRVLGWSWAALALVACGQTHSADPVGAGGAGAAGGGGSDTGDSQRLLTWQLEADGSEPLVLGAYDTELQQHCRFLPDAEGTLRCLPLVPGALQATYGYTDPECARRIYSSTRAAAGAARSAAGRAVAVPPPLDSCAQQHTVGVLAEFPESAPRYFKIEAGCMRSGGLPAKLQEAEVEFELIDVSPPTRFVSGTEVDGALLAGRLRIREVETQQGFRSQRQLFDQRWQQACTLGERADALACFPTILDARSSFFVDQDCMGQQLWRAPACVEPAFIGKAGEYYALGEEWAEPIFEMAKVCGELTPPSGDRYYAQGEPLDTSAVVAAAWLTSGSGRLRLRGLQGDDGQPVMLSDELFDSSSLRRASGELHVARYYDAQLDVDCGPVFTTEGEVRCVPSTALIDPMAWFYVDEQCSEPAYLCPKPEGCEGVDMITMGYDDNGEYRAFSRNATQSLAGEPIFTLQAERCVQQLGSEGMLRQGAERPWDDYALLNEVNGRRSGAP